MSEATKVCPNCERELSRETDFYARGEDGVQSWCKACTREAARERSGRTTPVRVPDDLHELIRSKAEINGVAMVRWIEATLQHAAQTQCVETGCMRIARARYCNEHTPVGLMEDFLTTFADTFTECAQMADSYTSDRDTDIDYGDLPVPSMEQHRLSDIVEATGGISQAWRRGLDLRSRLVDLAAMAIAWITAIDSETATKAA